MNNKRKRDDGDVQSENEEIKKQCIKCSASLDLSMFNMSKHGKYGRRADCRTCQKRKKRASAYGETLEAFCLQLLSHCRSHTVERNVTRSKDDRPLLEQPTITMDWLMNKIKVKKTCYYTGVPLMCSRFSKWQFSLERLDNDIGYTEENVVFACLECNTPKQWSAQVITAILDPSTAALPIADSTAKVYIRSRMRVPPLPDGKICCPPCTRGNGGVPVYKSPSEFPKGARRCKACNKTVRKANTDTLRGRLQTILRNAKATAKVSGGRKTFDLTIEQLEQLWEQQDGKCGYSGIPMHWRNGSTFMVSLERNPLGNYTFEDVQLIINELNCIDKTSKITKTTAGRGALGWSREKIEEVRAGYKAGVFRPECLMSQNEQDALH